MLKCNFFPEVNRHCDIIITYYFYDTLGSTVPEMRLLPTYVQHM
jgi:hypothetical protein